MNSDNNFMDICDRKYIVKKRVRVADGLLSYVILALLMLLSACDPGSTINYSIVNNNSRPLKVKYQFVFTTSKDTSVKEVVIMANSAKLISSEKVLGYVDRVVKKRDSIYLYKLILFQGDDIIHRNFKDKKYWRFNRVNEKIGTYSLTID